MPELLKYKIVVFDLDDTLYCEKDYLFAAYRRIADYTEKQCGGKTGTYYNYLTTHFLEKGRAQLLDNFIQDFHLSVNKDYLLYLLRTVDCRLTLQPTAKTILGELLLNNSKVYILTNGNLVQQENKIRCLQLKEQFEQIEVVHATGSAAKPAPDGLLNILQAENAAAEDMVFVGDSETDEQTATAAKVKFINIRDI